MNPNKARSVTLNTPADSDNTKLIECIADNVASLLGIIRSYVMRMGLARGEEVSTVALEVLQEVVLEALDHADRFILRPTNGLAFGYSYKRYQA